MVQDTVSETVGESVSETVSETAADGKTKPMTKKMGGTLLIRLVESDRVLFEEASKADGFTHVSEWVRHKLRSAAKRSLKKTEE